MSILLDVDFIISSGLFRVLDRLANVRSRFRAFYSVAYTTPARLRTRHCVIAL